jgi:hypothetical protein
MGAMSLWKIFVTQNATHQIWRLEFARLAHGIGLGNNFKGDRKMEGKRSFTDFTHFQ